ncbi:MAG TPA: hypothetical protein VKA30_02475 [Actinomycetota bacterium]|nr:hypothetical protein [Actinomycetota bacterium]
MNTLRRGLYLVAALWTVAGLTLLFAPRFVVVSLFNQPVLDLAWPRLVGLNAFGLALIVVLVAQRAEELWWWSWAFALVAVGTAGVALLHAAFGLADGQSSVVWWVLGIGSAAVSLLLLSGLYVTARRYEAR